MFLIVPGFIPHSVSAQIDNEAEKILENVQDTAEGLKANPWEYLGDKWRAFFLEIPAVKKIDSFFQKINWFFVVFFGKSYVLSGVLFLSILFWIHFYRIASYSMTAFSAFSTWISYLLALGLTILIAQANLFYLLAGWCFKLLFYREGFWSWVSVPVFILINLFVFAFLHTLINGLKLFIKGQREKEKEEETEINRKTINKTGEAIRGD